MFKFLVYLKRCGEMLILCFNESTGNTKVSYLAFISVFHEFCVEKCWKLMAMLKIRTSIDIFKNEKCKVTFGLEYIIQT